MAELRASHGACTTELERILPRTAELFAMEILDSETIDQV